MGEGEERGIRSGGGGSRILPKLPEGNVGLSADFWLTRETDDVTVQKSTDASEVEPSHPKLLWSGIVAHKIRLQHCSFGDEGSFRS